jgi:CBS domain-containing protein
LPPLVGGFDADQYQKWALCFNEKVDRKRRWSSSVTRKCHKNVNAKAFRAKGGRGFLYASKEVAMNATDVMVRAVVTIKPNDTVAKATDLFVKHDISALPVVDNSGTVVGIVS